MMETTTIKIITSGKNINTRILVNWVDRTIIQSNYPLVSDEYKALLDRGYVYVGILKKRTGKIFWNHEFFKPQDKYLNHEKSNNHGSNGLPDHPNSFSFGFLEPPGY